ncbi:hypothetical protein NBRC116494_14450 [Aurantivibrio plasticivorans]
MLFDPKYYNTLIFSALLVCFSLSVQSAPGDVLFEEYFNNNGDLNSDWDRSSTSDVGVSSDTFLSPSNSAFIRQGSQTLTLKSSRSINAQGIGVDLTLWIRRGNDSFSEDPDSGEDLRVQYLNDNGSWVTLEQFAGDGTPGEIFTPIYNLPSDALYNGLRVRFWVIDGNTNADYWHIDDVIITEAAVAAATLIAEWQMEELSWSGSSGEVVDSSGNGNNATAVGGVTTSELDPAIATNPGTCRYGDFDGVDDYLTWSGLSSTLNSTASMAFWIQTTQTGNNTGWQAPGIAGVEESGGTDDIFWGWLDASGRIGISVANDFTTKSSTSINNGAWHHIVLTRDHSAGSYKIYIDGALDASGSIATGVIGNSYSSIGRIEDTGGSPEYFQGLLDEVRVYDGVLTDAVVTAIMAETHPCATELCPLETPQGGLVGSYYNGTSLSGGVVGTRVDTVVNFNWGSGSPGVPGIGTDQFSVSWDGYIRVTETGDYYFRTISDDGVRLRVGGQLIIDNWTDHAAQIDTSAAVTLTAGQHYAISLEYYENFGLSEIRLQWSTPSSGSYVTIPSGPTPLGAGLYYCANTAVSYYEISHSGNGITCEGEPITITAYDAGGATVDPLSGTTLTLSTTPAGATWSGGNTYVFDGTTSIATKYLQQTTPATLNIDVTDGIALESASADPDITFTDVGVRFYGDTGLNALPTQVAAVTDPNLVLRVVETSTDTGACVARLQNTNRDVELGFECRNPTSCIAGQTLSLNSTPITANDLGAAINYSTVNLSFDANGFAAIPFNYTDVGQIRLHTELNLPPENDDPAITITGTSSEFVVQPDSLEVTTVETPAAVANPGTTSSGSGFVAAGDPFTVVVEARNASGNLTPNYGNETTVESVTVNLANLTFPIGGSVGVLTNPSSFSASNPGEFTNISLSWNEVGTMQISASVADGDYLGTGDITGNASADIGRFYPVDFDLVASAVSNSCVAGSYTYMSDAGISVSYDISARNRAGVSVVNYDNTDLNYITGSVTLQSENNDDGVNLSNRLVTASSTWDDGVYSLVDTAADFQRDMDIGLNVIPDGPFNALQLGVQVSDADGADFNLLDMNPSTAGDCVAAGNCNTAELSGVLNAIFGQLYLRDVHGPESAPIPMVWQTEYWDGVQFVTNINDQCTQLPLSAVNFVGATSVINAAADTIAVTIGSATSIFDFSDPIGFDDCLSGAAIGMCNGKAGIQYGAPGVIAAYPIDINLTGLPYLQGDWNLDGDHSDTTHPRVIVRFENYRGHDRVIYWREVLQ